MMNAIESDNIVGRHTTSPPSARGVVTFGEDDVMPHTLSSSFYEGEDDYTTPVRQDRKGSADSNQLHHVEFNLNLPGGHGDGGSGDVDVNENSGGSGDGSGSKKFLTAKYKKQRMGLVRRRIEVEDWIDVELRKLYNLPSDSYDTYEAEIDLDELLEISSESERIAYVQKQLTNTSQPVADINAFIQELLTKIATL